MLLLNPFLRRSSSRSATSGRARTGRRDRMTGESLEIRNLLSATWPGLLDPQAEAEPNDTLDDAQDVGQVSSGEVVEFVGMIGRPSPSDSDDLSRDRQGAELSPDRSPLPDGRGSNSSYPPRDSATNQTTDVDWIRFTLAAAGRVQIQSLPDAGGANAPVVLTLYGDRLAEFDPTVPLQHRSLGRQESNANDSARPVDLRLEAGTYFLAISGAGNRFFHPFVADSGVAGETTDYGVRIAVTSGQAPTGNQDQFAPVTESRLSGDDTFATASDLGDLTAIERLQVTGLIGDDRFYNVDSTNPFAMNPAADVDLYRFSITGDGTFGLIAASFAGRFGSPLDSALTLFRADDAGALQLVATNNDSLNSVESTNGLLPFFSDPVLFAGLSAGEYFLAVSSSGNDAQFGPDGIFDPQVAHSGLSGGSVGNYVLDLSVYADDVAPQVVGHVFNVPGLGEVELSERHVENVPHAPTQLNLQFSEPVNVQQLANSAFTSVSPNTIRAVFIEGTDGTRYFPRLQSYDTATETARFLLLDRLPNGDFELHVSGGAGLSDFAGNAIVGNDASGDFVTRFTVSDTTVAADVALRTNASGNDSFETAQDLGVLFPHELQAGIQLIRDAATNAAQPADTADFFRFELLQDQAYFFTLSDFGDGTPPAIEVLNDAGQVMPLAPLPGGRGVLSYLPAGSYVLHLGAWDTASASNVTYQVEVELGGASENPTPLTSGAAPAAGIRLAGFGPAPVFVPPVVADLSQSQAAIPSGLLVGLNAPALGGQGFTTPAFTPETALVRLFGFSNRDQLFSLIDSTLPRAPEAPEVTRAELTDDELRDLLNQNREATGETESETESDPSPVEDSRESATDAERRTAPSAVNDTTESTDNTNAPTASRPVPRSRPAASRSVRPAQIEIQSAKEKQPAAFSAPLAFALATSLATTLRERARRRDGKQPLPNSSDQIPLISNF
ncbi:MAG: DVUA0089 family protein [Planctomycetaceae bacterium]